MLLFLCCFEPYWAPFAMALALRVSMIGRHLRTAVPLIHEAPGARSMSLFRSFFAKSISDHEIQIPGRRWHWSRKLRIMKKRGSRVDTARPRFGDAASTLRWSRTSTTFLNLATLYKQETGRVDKRIILSFNDLVQQRLAVHSIASAQLAAARKDITLTLFQSA